MGIEAENDEQKNAMANTNRTNTVNFPAPNPMIPASETLSASQLIFPLSLGGDLGNARVQQWLYWGKTSTTLAEWQAGCDFGIPESVVE